VREVEEEMGLEVKPKKLLGVFQSPDDSRSPGHFIFAYTAKIISGEIEVRDKREC